MTRHSLFLSPSAPFSSLPRMDRAEPLHFPPEDPNNRPPNSRLFIGNLATERTNEHEIVEVFSKYGRILERPVLRRSFGFIQFDNAESAGSALKGEHGRIFHDMRLDISVADNREPRRGPPRSRASPPRGGPGPDHGRRSPPPPPHRRDMGRYEPYDRRGHPSNGGPSRRERTPSPPRRSPDYPIPSDGVICRIIVLGTSSRPYADFVAQQLARSGIGVDTAFLERRTLAEAIKVAEGRGCRYVVVIGRDDEGGSCSLKILQGRRDGSQYHVGYERISWQRAIEIIRDEEARIAPPQPFYSGDLSSLVPLPADFAAPGGLAPVLTPLPVAAAAAAAAPPHMPTPDYGGSPMGRLPVAPPVQQPTPQLDVPGPSQNISLLAELLTKINSQAAGGSLPSQNVPSSSYPPFSAPGAPLQSASLFPESSGGSSSLAVPTPESLAALQTLLSKVGGSGSMAVPLQQQQQQQQPIPSPLGVYGAASSEDPSLQQNILNLLQKVQGGGGTGTGGSFPDPGTQLPLYPSVSGGGYDPAQPSVSYGSRPPLMGIAPPGAAYGGSLDGRWDDRGSWGGGSGGGGYRPVAGRGRGTYGSGGGGGGGRFGGREDAYQPH